jgi:Undecaprenyl-phosphate glucose phosphotransferase
MTKSDQKLSTVFSLADIVALISSYAISCVIILGEFDFVKQLTLLALTVFVWLNLSLYRRLYHIHLHNGFKIRYKNFLKTFFMFSAFVSFSYLLFNIDMDAREFFLLFLGSFIVSSTALNLALISYIRYLRSKGKNLRYALVIGVGNNAQNIFNHFRFNPDLGYRAIGCVRSSNEKSVLDEQYILGDLDGLVDIIESERRVDEIIIALPFNSSEKIQKVLEVSDFFGKRVKYIPDYVGLLGRNFQMTTYGDVPVLDVRQTSLDMLPSAFLKRIFDIVFSGFVLFFLSPLYMVIAIMIKLESPGPVFYLPIRIGRNGKEFQMYKFRSMRSNDSVFGGTQSTRVNDPRITKIGAFIRRTSLDELPQFINVFLGDMSVVGPRPHRSFLDQQLQAQVEGYMLRHYLKPGITGWAQVNGWRGPTETEEQRFQRTYHDLHYLEHWSFSLDIKIIWLTVFGTKTHQAAY